MKYFFCSSSLYVAARYGYVTISLVYMLKKVGASTHHCYIYRCHVLLIEQIPYQVDELHAGEHLCDLNNKAILPGGIIKSLQINENDTRLSFFIKVIQNITCESQDLVTTIYTRQEAICSIVRAWSTSSDIRLRTIRNLYGIDKRRLTGVGCLVANFHLITIYLTS